ncbi:MAG: glycosyltransferase, partial [Halioglobus sp.]|nr:glycosyltransferase [Halioglobus sp.]
ALVISVGNLVLSKGHELVIEAVSGLQDVALLIIGSGPLKNELQAQIDAADLQSRVTLLQEVRQEELADYYNAADVLVLASSTEGMPNVVLESMACGTPVIATEAGGLKEFLETAQTSTKLSGRTAEHIRQAITAVLAAPPERQAVLQDVAGFDWRQSSVRSCNMLRKISQRNAACDHGNLPD